ncbi:hypothetical protein [Ktedonospora formicarum]|uniref:Uncharacterized protein n=1 Tax=Ktedonospora formicarum TaxID=2778364 RepID=A0A8J3MSG7_9CHLR|nr:hypothetical protein [Ktedonospora formicarum]GHO46105.1 hypothetical protein KSX_42680 [Ktedonospora formicarum]
MTIDQLLQDLEILPHAGRVQKMIELGRRSKSDPEIEALLNEMAQGEWYQRFLALYSCFGSANAAQVLATLTHSSRILRGLALRLLPLVCNQIQLQQVLENAPPALRLPLLWNLSKHGHYACIDRFVERLSPDDPQFCQIVCFTSEGIMRRLASLFQHRARLQDWSRLARFHPQLVIEMLVQWSKDGKQEEQIIVQHLNTLLPRLILVQPEQCLQLLTTLVQFISLDKFKLQPLVNRFPFEITELILAQKQQIVLDWWRFIPRLSDQQILALCTKQKYMRDNASVWFPLLSLEKRLFIYNNGRELLRNTYSKKLPHAVIAALPTAQRSEEGRKHFLSTQQERRIDLKYAVFLPWDEVQSAIEPYLHNSDSGRRSEAFFAQIGAVLYHRSQFSAILELLLQRRTEHDGVRRGILFALMGLPVAFWQEEHLAYLEQIIRHGLNDLGLSEETLRAIIKLLLRLLPSHFDWSAQQLIVVLRERGFLTPTPYTENDFMSHKVPKLQIEPALSARLLDFILPTLQAWIEQEKETELLDVITYLFPRGPLPEKVAHLLMTLLKQVQSIEISKRVLRMLAHYEPQQLATLLPALLQDDASWITQPIVSAYLLRSRQELLTPYLTSQAYSGRFSTGRKQVLPLLVQSATCLTTNQQVRFASALLEQIQASGQDSRSIVQAIKCLAFLPANPSADLLRLAQQQNPIIRTTALFTLGRLDSSDGIIPELLAALQDSRARIAIVVLRPLLLRLPPSQALTYLRMVPQQRVTVAKEKARLIGDLASEDAYQELLSLEQQELHHDVRIALLSTLWKYPQYAQTWAIMERVIQDQDVEMALEAVPPTRLWNSANLHQRIEATGLTAYQHSLRLSTLLLQHPNKRIRFSIFHRHISNYRRLEGTDSNRDLLLALAQMAEMGEKEERQNATKFLFRLCSSQDSDLISQVFRSRLSRFDILQEMVSSLDACLKGLNFLSIIRGVLDVLATSPFTTLLRLQLAISHLPADELILFLCDLAASNELHADALIKACHHFDRDLGRFDLPILERLENIFASSEDERLRRLALALLLEQVQRTNRWSAANLYRLRRYRTDTSLMVATAAQFTFTEVEMK